MKNTQLLKHAIELLKTTNTEDLESVQINGAKYRDGTYSITIDLTYPAKERDNE